jgi:hypothetical protein
VPPFRLTAGEKSVGLLGAKGIARRVTGAAVRQTLHQIGAAIPFGVSGAVRLEASGLEEQELPAGDQRPEVEWKRKIVRRGFGAHRLARHQERVDRGDVVGRHFGEMVVRKRRIEVPAVSAHAFVQ